jgi:uncharacterized protein (TIGR02246 family)
MDDPMRGTHTPAIQPACRMKITTFIAAALASTCVAQSTKETNGAKEMPPEKAAVLALDREYEAAFAKGDAPALAAFFAEDAEYTTDDGNILRGRAKIEQSLREGLQANKGAKLAIALESVSLLAPEVAVEKGSSSVTAKDGENSASSYTAIYVKKDGKWKISHLIETPQAPATPRERLEELAWLAGEWNETDPENNLSVHSQYTWARGGNFLTRNVTVQRAGETTLEGWQVIGWDPLEEHIRSWTFDSEGGFAQGNWTRDGERWLVREAGVAPDGTRTGSDQTFTKLSPDRLVWESNNRTLNGEPQPNIGRIEIHRVKAK